MNTKIYQLVLADDLVAFCRKHEILTQDLMEYALKTGKLTIEDISYEKTIKNVTKKQP